MAAMSGELSASARTSSRRAGWRSPIASSTSCSRIRKKERKCKKRWAPCRERPLWRFGPARKRHRGRSLLLVLGTELHEAHLPLVIGSNEESLGGHLAIGRGRRIGHAGEAPARLGAEADAVVLRVPDD